MKNSMIKIATSIIVLLMASASFADIDEFKDTVWVGSSEEERNVILTISEQLHWNYSFTDEEGNRHEYSGIGAIEETLFEGEESVGNPLVLVLTKDGKPGAPPLAIVKENGDITLLYDELILTEKDS